ncbi:hypothetical protein MASR1M8_23050 [Thermomonas brevis]
MVAGQQQQLREIFFLQVAIVCLVVVLAVLGVQTLSGRTAYPGFTFAAIGIATAAVGVVMWMSYRATKRTMAPVDWVLRQVARWDPQRPDTHMLAPENVPAGVQGDARKLAEAMHQLAARLDAHVARERDFTRDASHELRTPLTVIRVATDLIGHDEGLSQRSRRSLGRIQAAVDSMEALTAALLLLARDQDVQPETEDFPARDVIEREVERIRLLAEEKGLALEVAVEAEPVLHGPPRILGVMLGNVLSNAVRFTGHGSVRLRLLADRIEVDDTGIGMDAASLARAFEPFYRVNIEQPEGPGLGLSIAHRLGERCGWPLQLASHPGEGTRATILLDDVR